MLESVTECYRVLQSITENSRVLQNIKEYYRVFLAHLLGPISGLVNFSSENQVEQLKKTSQVQIETEIEEGFHARTWLGLDRS